MTARSRLENNSANDRGRYVGIIPYAKELDANGPHNGNARSLIESYGGHHLVSHETCDHGQSNGESTATKTKERRTQRTSMYRDKISGFISPKQVANIIDGTTFAWKLGFPLTRAISFNCSLMGIDSLFLASRFTKLSGDWLRKRNVPVVYVWVRENPKGISNLHLSVHVPRTLMKEYVNMHKRWLVQTGAKLRAKGIYSQEIGVPRGRRNRSLPESSYLCHLEYWINYTLKGGHPAACRKLSIDSAFQGEVLGRRVGLSESISATARLMSGYQPPSSRRTSIIFGWRYLLDDLTPSDLE